MLVYGDHSETVMLSPKLEELAHLRDSLGAMPPGLQRHGRLVELLTEGGRLLQGIADREFEQTGADGFSPASAPLGEWLIAVGSAVVESWTGRFRAVPVPPHPPRLRDSTGAVELRNPEGYAFYSLYPEAYAEAARRVRLHGQPRVIGIRSIGTSLGAIVAAAVGAKRFLTVRPFGDPAAREIAVSDRAAQVLIGPDAHFLIADEGPGQSGSSFAAVSDWLSSKGVAAERITLLPSHPAGPLGAGEVGLKRWKSRQRVVADIGPKLPALLKLWLADVIGPVDKLRDISGGAWRERVYEDEARWPAVNPAWERRKYLAEARGTSWVVKFAGLGRQARSKLDRARKLHELGLAPEPLGLVDGFLVERWEEGGRLAADERPLPEIAEYLAARARLFPGGEGADAADLLAMAKRNAGLCLGERAAHALGRWDFRTGALEQVARRVAVDGKMEPHEWLRRSDGKLLKTDALDHWLGHDLIGCQDIAWDLAGAIVDFDLDQAAAAKLLDSFERASGAAVDRELLDFLTDCYIAFRIGQCALSAEMTAADTAESARFRRKLEAYAARISSSLGLERQDNDRPAVRLGARPQRESGRNNRAAASVDEEEAVPSC